MANEPAVGAAVTIDSVRAGYAFEGAALDLGALVTEGTAHPDVPVRIPLSMLTRHGLVAGATGTGKTKTLQLMAEQLAAGKYSAIIDRESAYERLAAKLAPAPTLDAPQSGEAPAAQTPAAPKGRAKASGVEVLGTAVATAVATTSAREIMRGLFGNRRR